MKTSIENCPKNVVKNDFKHYWLSVATFIFFAAKGLAENTLNSSEDAAVLAKKLEYEHQTNMSYVYMVIGFIIILGIAWFSVAKSKGNDNSENSEHHHNTRHHHHNVHDKRYGTNRAR